MVRVSRQTKNWIYRILTIILTMALAAGAIFGIYKLVEKSKEKTKTIHPSFAVGALDSKGEYIKTEKSLYTKDAFECQGLKIAPSFDNNISYEVFFYDSTGAFISTSGKQVKDYKTVPFFAARARIVITPNETEDGAVEVTWFNKSKYSKQLKITVDKTQKSVSSNVLTEENLIADMNGKYFNREKSYELTDGKEIGDFRTFSVSVKSGQKLIFHFNSSALGGSTINLYFCENDKIVSDKEILSLEEGLTVEIPKNATSVYITLLGAVDSIFAFIV